MPAERSLPDHAIRFASPDDRPCLLDASSWRSSGRAAVTLLLRIARSTRGTMRPLSADSARCELSLAVAACGDGVVSAPSRSCRRSWPAPATRPVPTVSTRWRSRPPASVGSARTAASPRPAVRVGQEVGVPEPVVAAVEAVAIDRDHVARRRLQLGGAGVAEAPADDPVPDVDYLARAQREVVGGVVDDDVARRAAITVPGWPGAKTSLATSAATMKTFRNRAGTAP